MVEQDMPIDVAVIGAGPAGLAAATALKDAGVGRVVVIDREPQAGGIPRHCNHYPYGLREFGRLMKGPDYAARLVQVAQNAGVEIHTNTTVTSIAPGGGLSLVTHEGPADIAPRRVIYATGVRETPRSARLISGARVQGVVNTGALQSMVYLKQRRPFKRPVIIGSELVSFSAIMTCRAAGIQPVAMIEASNRATARWPSVLYPRLMGIDVMTQTRLDKIEGDRTVEAVSVIGPYGQTRQIDCDGVILTGGFTPDIPLARCGHLQIDPGTGGPVVDQWGRCSDPAFFATGNVLRPVETAGRSWAEGRTTGAWVAQDLDRPHVKDAETMVRVAVNDERLKYAMPQQIRQSDVSGGAPHIQMRVRTPVSGILVAHSGGQRIWHKKLTARPERRIEIPIADLVKHQTAEHVEFSIEEMGKNQSA